ncbi:hypothetical protein YUYDRAFT_02135 [Streptomyces sp. ScaeMP-e48]|uniref:hypothetical protein n=1 Tax=Streptomyces sp. ScaeMP-e48 TaxID=1100823 RepID=UPI000823C0D8|nr:hypothetical protein [Streptomyces sp. ScaeMP-e48]SCK20458.1 hypothetical protein YUYDRAFT_02135 [Streptomyces sp. ScaeMP-e48]
MSAGADPLRVSTSDGAVWVRAAVTRAGLGLYCPEGVVSCPRFVMATLLELAEHGVKVAPSVTDLPSAVALMGALPMPVGGAAELEATTYVAPSPSCTRCYGADAVRFVANGGVTAPCHACAPSELEELRARVAELEAERENLIRWRREDDKVATQLRGRVAELKAERADRYDDLAGALGHSSGTEWSDLISVAAASTASEARPVEDPHDSPLHHSYAVGRDLPEVTREERARRTESVAKLQALLSRQTDGAL